MSDASQDATQPREKSRPDPRIGEVIAERFRIIEPIGKGGFATVYRGVQLNLDQPVAVKVLDIGDEEQELFMERFLREARTAAKIRHPDIVTIIDFGSTNQGEPYIVLELLEGQPLDEALKDGGPMEPARALKLMVRCLDALQAAHEKGVVHRDLKPANLYVSGSGTMVESLKVLDFGIARAVELEQQDKLTVTGQLLGTPSFLPPEYIQDHVVSPALDVYQMGLILVEMLTGQSVVEGRNLYQSMMAHCTGALNIPPELLNSPLGAVIAKAVTRDLSLRFATAGEFRDALKNVNAATVPPAVSYTMDPQLALADTGQISGRSMNTPNHTPTTGPNSGTADLIATLASQRLPAPSTDSAIDLRLRQAAASPAPSVPTARLFGVAAIVFIITLSLGLFIVFQIVGGSKSPEDPAETAEATEETPEETPPGEDPDPAEVAVNDPTEANGAQGEEPAAIKEAPPKEDPEPPAPEPQEVQVSATPATAQIFLGDELLGTGTATVRFEGESPEAVTLTVRAKGYDEASVEVQPGEAPEPITLARARPTRHTNKTPNNRRPPETGKGDKGATSTETKKPPTMGIIDKNKKKTKIDIIQ